MTKLFHWAAFVSNALTFAQQIGPTPEVHPTFTTYKCTKGQECIRQNTTLVLDYFWRNVQDIHTGQSCLTDSFELNTTICPTAEECAQNCALDGADYSQTGVQTSGDDTVTLQMYHTYDGSLGLVSPQVYLLDESTQDYVLLKLLNQEVSFDIDISKSPCGVDAALYLSGMDASGGRSELNPAGASYGTGYCDSQCWDGWPFINGVANVDRLGVCCNEMDLWEANARSTQLTAHPCNITGLFGCSGDDECGWHKGVCDRSGCAFNPYSLGAHEFYGHEKKVDTYKPFKVITQFFTDDGSAEGTLSDIHRLYIQDGKLIHNAAINFKNGSFDSMSTGFCDATSTHFAGRGGLPLMGEALRHGMVAVLGIWNDPSDYNNWLDSGDEGPCGEEQGKPSKMKSKHPDTSVTFSNLRWGDIGSTCDT